MATRSRARTPNLSEYDVPAFVQERRTTVNEHGDTINAKDQPRLLIYCNIKERERVDGSKEITQGEEVKLLKFDVRTPYDLELYEALRSEFASFEFDGEVNEVANVTLVPSYSRPKEIVFVCHHGQQDWSKDPL